MLFKPIIPLVEYVVFYDYIKTELCVNTDLPELKCDGKCFLMQELAKSSDLDKGKEKNHSPSSQYNIVFYQETNKEDLAFFSNDIDSKVHSTYNNTYKFYFIDTIFHPPLS